MITVTGNLKLRMTILTPRAEKKAVMLRKALRENIIMRDIDELNPY